MKKIILFISLLSLLPSLVWADSDWRLEIFDRSQELFRTFEKEEAELMIAINPDVQTFFDVRIPFDEADRKMSRYVFIMRLNKAPQSIEWNDPYFWGDLSSEESEELANQDIEYKNLRDEFLLRKQDYIEAKEVIRLRNKIYENHSVEFYKNEQELHRQLMLLKEEALAKLGN